MSHRPGLFSLRPPVLAIDPSLTGFAMTIHRPSVEEITRVWKTTGQKGATPRQRMERYFSLVEKLRFEIKDDLSMCFIEGYAYGAKGSSGVTLGEFGGVLRSFLMTVCRDVIEISPTAVKKFATGKGNASKVEVASALSKRYDTQFQSDNHADAFAIARIGCAVMGYEKPQTEFQKTVVAAVREKV